MSVTTAPPIRMDFSKYARPELIACISRIVYFVNDSLESLLVPSLAFSAAALLCTYYLSFSNSLFTCLFLAVGVLGGACTGFLYGCYNLVRDTSRDLKEIVVQSVRLVNDILDDICSYAKDTSAIPPVSEIVRSVIDTVILPVVNGVLGKKFYGGIAMWALDPIIRIVGKGASSSLASMEKFYANKSNAPTLNDREESKFSNSEENKHMMATEETPETRIRMRDAVYKKKEQMKFVLESAQDKILPFIDTWNEKLEYPLKSLAFISGVITCVLLLVIYVA